MSNVEDYFNKSFAFEDNENWTLPLSAYTTPAWKIDSLQQMKTELNCVKGQLSNFNLEKWSRHTRSRDPSSDIVSTIKSKANIEVLTQAWCKFYECLNQYPIVPQFAIEQCQLKSLHLCEAPGAFISALNHFLYTYHRRVEWTWTANTLNPYYEGHPQSRMINDDRLIRCTLEQWDFGIDQTGDITEYYNHIDLVAKGRVTLVTADGSVDCMDDPGEQENNVNFLHYCEVLTALQVLEMHGSFVLKIFTMFEHNTVCILYLLNCCFVKVNVFKPCTSKSGNSEVYVICVGFKGWMLLKDLWPSLLKVYQFGRSDHVAMFALNELNQKFLCQVEECARYFMRFQSFTINENVRHFIAGMYDKEAVTMLKTVVTNHFIWKYRFVFNIPKWCRLIKDKSRKHKFSNRNGWEFIEIHGKDIVIFDVNVANVRTGRAITQIHNSQFCTVKNLDLPLTDLGSTNFEFLPGAGTKTIRKSDFRDCLTSCEFHKEFFDAIIDQLGDYKNVVITGIPLLSRFLVGLTYILGIGFESILVINKGVLVFRKPREETFPFVLNYFKLIDGVYRSLNQETRFANDILEVVPHELLEIPTFYEIMCQYNNRLYA